MLYTQLYRKSDFFIRVLGFIMPISLYKMALLIVVGIALVRSFSVLLFTVRTLLRRRDFVAAKLGPVEYSAIPEPILLALLAIFLFPASSLESPSLLQQVGAILGAILALGGGLFSLWTLRSLPSMGSGHYVLPDQKLVDNGPYGLVRHPIYLFAFLVWLALAVGYASLVILAVFVVYSMPILVLYAREEEKLMLEQFGLEYREYQKRVGMFFPRL